MALEAFLWYIPMESPSPREALALRMALAEWVGESGAKVWMVVKQGDKKLKKWAEFMGFTYRDEYDAKHLRYVRN